MKKKKKIIFGIAIIYLLLMIYLLFLSRISGSLFARELSFQDHIKQYVSLLPFRSIIRYTSALLLHTMNTRIPIINLFGNILVFVPAGIFMPVFLKKARTWKRVVIITVISIFIIELIQFFTYTGTFDIDDIILNTVGVILGFGLWKLFLYHFRNHISNKK